MWKTIVIFGVILLILALIMALPTMWLANYVFSKPFLVYVFGGKLGFFKALAVNILAGILFKSSSSNGSEG